MLKKGFLFFVLFGLAPHLFGQQANVPVHRELSPADSVLADRYVDSAYSYSIFSQKYQRYMDSALAICPWQAGWWQQKAMPLFKQKKYEIGLPYLDSAVKYNAHRYIDYRAFMKCIFQKSYRSAIVDFRASKSIIGATGVVMDHTYDFYIGLCYLQLNQLDSAEHYLTVTTFGQQKEKGDVWVHYLDWFYLGIVYYEKDDPAKAIEMFDNSIRKYKNFPDAKYYKAICLMKLHRADSAKIVATQAEADFKQGYTINEDNAVYETYPYQKDKLIYYTGFAASFDHK